MPTNTVDLYERLAAAASLESDDAAIRITAEYQPSAGPDAKVFPPTYPRPGERTAAYLVEERYNDSEQVHAVLLDATQSQANRCEEALQEAVDAGRVALPTVELRATVADQAVRITMLQAPHRSRDAYFRDSRVAGNGAGFDDTPIGRALAAATESAALAYFLHAPVDLVYGSWDSHRGKRRPTRFPRVYSSELVGYEPLDGRRGAGRVDPYVLPGKSGITVPRDQPSNWDPDAKAKGESRKLSEHGHGSIPPTLSEDGVAGGGVSVRKIIRRAVLTFAPLARLRFSADPAATSTPETDRAARATLATVALLGDRLAFARPSVFLRSGCDLVLVDERIEWVRRGAATEPLALTTDEALALFTLAVERADDVGLTWDTQPMLLEPADNLRVILERALTRPDLDEAKE